VLGGTATASGDMLDVLRDVATHLRAGDTSTLGTTDLKAVTTEIENLLAVRARVGASMNRVQTANDRLVEIEGVGEAEVFVTQYGPPTRPRGSAPTCARRSSSAPAAAIR
jgi:hypothetical protein